MGVTMRKLTYFTVALCLAAIARLRCGTGPTRRFGPEPVQ